MIRAGRVSVDGVSAHLGQKVDPDTALVEVDGVPLPIKPGLVHYLLYKPVGVVSTASDPQGRRTVIDLVPDDSRVYPAGRLDVDSEGLIVVTNDGSLTERLTHPRFGITKTYLAEGEGQVSLRTVRTLTSGVSLEDGPARAVTAALVQAQQDRSLVRIVMGEGRKREVRRMFDAVGHPVRRLVREAIGPLVDRTLEPGAWRELSIVEVRSLYSSAVDE